MILCMRKPIPRKNREKWILGSLYRFCSRRGYWPTSMDLAAFTGYGSREAWHRWLRIGVEQGLILRDKIRYSLTAKGCSVIGEIPIVATRKVVRWCNRNKGSERKNRLLQSRLDTSYIFDRNKEIWNQVELEVYD